MTDIEKPIHIRWEKDTRYYRVVFQKDLFCTWCLTLVWGKRNASLGQIKHLSVKSYQDGIQKISDIEKLRLKRNYCRVS